MSNGPAFTHCPECGSQLLPAAPGLPPGCPNPDCPAQVRARLLHWCAPDVMNIAGGDAPLIERLVRHGLVLDVADFYRLKLGELLELDGMSKPAAQDFLAAIAASKGRELGRLVLGLGLPNVNREIAGALGQTFADFDALISAPAAKLRAVPGMDEFAARDLAQWFSDSYNRKLIKRLRVAGVFR